MSMSLDELRAKMRALDEKIAQSRAKEELQERLRNEKMKKLTDLRDEVDDKIASLGGQRIPLDDARDRQAEQRRNEEVELQCLRLMVADENNP